MKILLALILLCTLLMSLAHAGAEEAGDKLHELAAPYGFKMGACLSYGDLSKDKTLNALKHHFSSITMTNEMKAYSLLDQQKSRKAEDGMPVMNYAAADAMVGWAQANGLKVRGHVLVWDAYMCDWFFREGYSTTGSYADQETVKARTEYYITQVITHFEEKFPGVVYCWDVVNEAVGDGITEYMPGDARHLRTVRSGKDNLFRTHMGDDYVELSFLYARNAVDALGADIQLFYNDYNAYFSDKSAAILALAESINHYAVDENGQHRKLMDGVGMQGYIGGYGTQSGCLQNSHIGMIKTAILNYANAGLDVHITEMAVRNFDPAQADRHAAFYVDLFKMFKSLQNEDGHTPLSCVAVWGYRDDPSLPKDHYNYRMNSPWCGLFDENMDEKNVLHLVMEELKR